MTAEYFVDRSAETWWCNSHNRVATHILKRGDWEVHHCEPGLAGILLPCECVNLDGLVEVTQ